MTTKDWELNLISEEKLRRWSNDTLENVEQVGKGHREARKLQEGQGR